ncbi:hypothetical protein P5G65_23755 [Paenibacillus chondroitinus]|uniref:Uncharacterized protein n=1 Tax=Paenibacillus chondroitinus TaxID=59842 RepID=A0ABU6DGM7_9BACL|nr:MULTISPECIES: hypothetical protein [Paenibacillus]MCY9659525.1 hypothetical protein [Paenibacillus anseongense]MEB4796920.1 hypothetical protein [Paenibacillus chondroitinus]
MSQSRGRPIKYSDSDLKEILVKYATKHQGKKINPSQLEKDTGIKRHVWLRRMQPVLDELNEPVAVTSTGTNTLPMPNVVELVEKNWNNKTALIRDLQHFQETLDSLYDQAKQYFEVNKELEDLKIEISKHEREVKELRKESKYYKDLYYKTSVKSTYNVFQEDEGLSNVISINKNKTKSLSTDLATHFAELFDDEDLEEEGDK